MTHYIFLQNERTRSARTRNRQIARLVYDHLEKDGKLPGFEELNDNYKE